MLYLCLPSQPFPFPLSLSFLWLFTQLLLQIVFFAIASFYVLVSLAHLSVTSLQLSFCLLTPFYPFPVVLSIEVLISFDQISAYEDLLSLTFLVFQAQLFTSALLALLFFIRSTFLKIAHF